MLFSMVCAALALFPRVDGPRHSFIFANAIASLPAADYIDRFRRAPTDAFLDDCLTQLHRNAQIAATKFSFVRKAMGWSFAAILPWLCAIVVLTQE